MTVQVKTRVLAGNRIEVSADGLREGQDVEVTITPIHEASPKKRGIMEFIKSLPPGPRSAKSWEEVERQFREERESWDR